MGHSQSKQDSKYSGRTVSTDRQYPPSTSGSYKESSRRKSAKSRHRQSQPLPQSPERTDTKTLSHNQPSMSGQELVAHQRTSFGHSGERNTPSCQLPHSGQSSLGNGGTSSKHNQIEKYFTKYKDAGEDAILAEGMEKFCIDLGVEPTEFIVLVLAWKFEASQMCRFTREEFMNGCQKLRSHDAKSLKERFPELSAEAKNERNFKDLYNFTFSFGLDQSSGQRSLPLDMAIPLWDLAFSQKRPDILNQWFNFLKTNNIKGISRDTWNMFLPFVETILPDLSNYDDSEAWPSLFDDFVESEQQT